MSGTRRVGDGLLTHHFRLTSDSSWAILRVHETLPTLSAVNGHIGEPQVGYAAGESGCKWGEEREGVGKKGGGRGRHAEPHPIAPQTVEAIFHDAESDTMFLVRESVDISGEVSCGGESVDLDIPAP